MNCPRCEHELPERAGHCPACGFSIDRLGERLGPDPVVLQLLMDVAGVLRRRERLLIEAQIEGFERKFPQLFFAVYVGMLAAKSNLREFGFWLLNRASVSVEDCMRPNANGVLLVVDVEGDRASLSAGYFVEPHLSAAAMADALKRGAVWWDEGQYGEGVRAVMDRVERQLRRAGRRARGGGSWPSVRAPAEGDQLGTVELGRLSDGKRLPTWRDL